MKKIVYSITMALAIVLLVACQSNSKHNVITFSSLGWWGSWLNENPEKITISPSVWINTTNHF